MAATRGEVSITASDVFDRSALIGSEVVPDTRQRRQRPRGRASACTRCVSMILSSSICIGSLLLSYVVAGAFLFRVRFSFRIFSCFLIQTITMHGRLVYIAPPMTNSRRLRNSAKMEFFSHNGYLQPTPGLFPGLSSVYCDRL